MNDVTEYTKSTPKLYAEVEKKPKVNYEEIARKKIEAEMKKKEEAKKKEQMVQDLEDMHIELMTFSKNLSMDNLKKALEIKEKLDNDRHPPAHFRVCTTSLWTKAFKHEVVKNYKYVKDQMEDLLVAEKNLNRNIDSRS